MSTGTTHDADCLVIGAGPAGCAAATILAEHGHRVTVLEKSAFPRYRVGESLIPYCWFPLERLGLIEKLDASDFVVRKHSVQFVGVDGAQTTPFYFFKHTEHDCARTWQVVRDRFDVMMRDHAVSRGATIRQQTAARELAWEDDAVVGVEARGPGGEDVSYRAPVTIDASGRDLFSVSRLDWRVADPELRKIAIWTYCRGAARDRGMDEGATTIAYLPEKGWFWYIPLPDDMVSVGVVAERDYLYRGPRDPQAIFDREVAAQPWIRERLASGEQDAECRVTGDYSYRSRHCAADGLVLTGDAYSFLDPVFSSGVFLALKGGVMVGDAVHAALERGDVSARMFGEYACNLCGSIEAMRRLVYAFYDHTFSFAGFLKANPQFSGDLTDCLIGNVEKDLEPMFRSMADLAEVPAPLTHGGPLSRT